MAPDTAKDGDCGADAPVLVALDFSRYSERALLWAVDYAAHANKRVVALHVVHDPESAPGYYSATDSSGHLISREDSAREMLDKFLERMGTEYPSVRACADLSSMLSSGLPANRILEIAEEQGACHIVLGSQGRTGWAGLLLGSKAQRVAQLASVPVTIVKDSHDQDGDQ